MIVFPFMNHMQDSSAKILRSYSAFISYRHSDNRETGRRWADWLQQAIETYEVPRDLVGKKNKYGEPIPATLYPVFRDESELPAGPDLPQALYRALEESASLIVLCSPRVCGSLYVAEEIRYFKALGKGGRILALIIEGIPNASLAGNIEAATKPDLECYPEPLRFGKADENGVIDWNVPTNPYYADVRPKGGHEQGYTIPAAYRAALERSFDYNRSELRRAEKRFADQLKIAQLKLIAGLLGVSFGELEKRDAKWRAQKRRRRALILAPLIMLGLAAAVFADVQRRRATAAQDARLLQLGLASRADEAAADDNLRAGWFGEALAYLGRAIRIDPLNRTAQTQLWVAVTLPTRPFLQLPDEVWEKTNPDFSRKLSLTGGEMLWESPEGGLELLTFPDRNRLAQIVLPGALSTLHSGHFPVIYSSKCRWVMHVDNRQVLKFWDSHTGQPVTTIDPGAPLGRPPLFAPDDSAIGLSNNAGDLRVWMLPSGQPFPHSIRCDQRKVDEAMLSPGGRFFFVRDFYGIPTLWDLTTGRVVAHDFVKGRPLVKVAFSGDGERLGMSWTRHRTNGQPEVLAETLAIWDCETGQRCSLNWAPPQELSDLQPSPDSPGWTAITEGKWMRYDGNRGQGGLQHCSLESSQIVDVGTEFSLPIMDRKGQWVCLQTKGGWWSLFERRVTFLPKNHPLSNMNNASVNYAVQRAGIGAGISRTFSTFKQRREVFDRMILDAEGRYLFARSKDGSGFLWYLRASVVGREASPDVDPTAPFPSISSHGLELVEDGTGNLRIREKATGKWATQPFWKRSDGVTPRWSLDGTCLEYSLDDGTKTAISLPNLERGPSWIERFTAAFAGFRFEANSQLQGVTLDERLALRESLRTQLQEGRLANDGDPAWERLLRWWLTPRTQRAAAP
jgi:MTH538 TIR-like domain (DUF1863)